MLVSKRLRTLGRSGTRSIRGVSLLEVLISVLLSAIGLLALAVEGKEIADEGVEVGFVCGDFVGDRGLGGFGGGRDVSEVFDLGDGGAEFLGRSEAMAAVRRNRFLDKGDKFGTQVVES